MPIVVVIGAFATIITGLTLVSTSDESYMQKAKGALIAIITGMFLVRLAPTMVRVFYEQQALLTFGTGVNPNYDNVTVELVGIAQWFEMLAITVAVFTIILAAFRAIASFGSESAHQAVRRSVLHGIGGILVIIFIGVIRIVFYADRRPNVLIQEIFFRVNIVLGFVAIVMIGIIIYAGLLMVLSVANEGNNEKAKGIIFRAIIGLIVVLLSVVLIQIVIGVFS